MQNIGTFYSWTITDTFNAEKECDKSFFDHLQTGIPQEIRWFFNAENIEERIFINIFYNAKRYDAFIDLIDGRTRLSWKSDLGDQLDKFSKCGKPIAHFQRINDENYMLNMQNLEEAIEPIILI